MPVTGLFLLPIISAESSPLQSIIQRLTTQYNPTPLPPWSLQHYLFRETPALPNQNTLGIDDRSKSSGPRYLQVLTLSHHPGRTYVAITSTNAPSQTRAGTPASSTASAESSGEPATIISIPSGPQSDEFVQLMASKFGPLWTQRQVLVVSNAQAFEVGDFRVRLGEVRQGPTTPGRAVVTEVEWNSGGGEDWETAEAVIKPFWDHLEAVGAKECFHVPGVDKSYGSVRQWCEILRLRG